MAQENIPGPPATAADEPLWVHDLSWDGRGVARRADGRVAMIFGAVPGDTVRIQIEREPKSGPIEATVRALLIESPQRVPHPCPHYAQGCPASQLGAVRREFALEWKRDHLVETLRRIGGHEGVVVEPVLPSSKNWRYRERLEFHVEHGSYGIELGYYGPNGLVPISDCRLGSSAIREPYSRLRASRGVLDPHHHLGTRVPLRLLLRDNGRGGAIAVLFVVTQGPVDSRPLEDWLNNGGLAGWEVRRVRNEKLRYVNSELILTHGDTTVVTRLAGRELTLPATVFTQVNRTAAGFLVDLVLEQVPRKGRLLDLYGGYGLFGIEYATRGGRATVIDSAPEAIAAGQRFIREDGLEVEFVQRDLGRDSIADMDLTGYSAAVLDPPRSGADEILLKVLNEKGPERLLYVSCHPAALARDLKETTNYSISLVVPLDMFPSTADLETLVILDRKSYSPGHEA